MSRDPMEDGILPDDGRMPLRDVVLNEKKHAFLRANLILK
jgi:hypothetical protein